MKIVIIGTSNSVIGKKGYIKALSTKHEVYNISVGRVPFYFHIFSIIKNSKLIKEADLLIIDHYVSDLNFYVSRLGENYIKDCENFYKILSGLNLRVLNIYFPIQNIQEKKSYFFLEKIKELSIYYNFDFLDLNDIKWNSFNYRDKLHLNAVTSYILGIDLANEFEIRKNKNEKFKGSIKKQPFSYISASDIAKKYNLELRKFKNSLIDIEYVVLPENIKLVFDKTIVGIGYFIPFKEEKKYGLKFNNKDFYLTGEGYCFETFFDEDISYENTICPLFNKCDNIPSIDFRYKESGEFYGAFISEILLKDNDPIYNIVSSKRVKEDYELTNIKNFLELEF